MNPGNLSEIMAELSAGGVMQESALKMRNSEELIDVAKKIGDFVGHGDVKSASEIENLLGRMKTQLADVDLGNLSSYGPATLIEAVRRLSKITDKDQSEIWNNLGIGFNENAQVLKPLVK